MRRVSVVLIILVVLAAAAVWLGSMKRTGPEHSGRLLAVVTIPPEAYFVERVGGEHVAVETLVRPGQSPHMFEPTPAQVGWLARAQVYFVLGFPSEKPLVDKIAGTNKSLRIVDISRGVPRRYMSADEAAGDRDEAESHEAGEPDPHTWLNPEFAKIEAANICAELKTLDPAHAADYDRNLARLAADLDALHARLADTLAPVRGGKVFVFHPAFGYFTDAYGLRQVPVQVEGKSPNPKQVAALIKKARAEGVRVIFVEPQFSPRGAEMIAEEIGGAVVSIDPLARDYITNLEAIASKIKEGLAR